MRDGQTPQLGGMGSTHRSQGDKYTSTISLFLLAAFSRISLETARDGMTGHEGEPPRLEDADEIQCEVSLPGTKYSETLVRRLHIPEARAGGQRSGLLNALVPFVVVIVSLLLQLQIV